MDYKEAYEKLEKYGQLHVLKYYDELTEDKKNTLLGQIAELDFSILKYCKENTTNQKGAIAPLAAMQLPEIEKSKEKYTEIGLEEIRKGRVAAVLLAGGWAPGWGRRIRKECMISGSQDPYISFREL